jgi:hypothetical protein
LQQPRRREPLRLLHHMFRLTAETRFVRRLEPGNLR